MEQAEDKKMIAEMKRFLSDKAKAGKSADDAKAEENLPFESIDSYSTDPVGFGEMSLRMMNKVEFVFDLAVKENRFSPKYLKRCTQLEKGIKYLGSLCVTKYALQTKGQTFPQLGQLSTEKLYCMTSHHFRKLDMAVTEYMFEHRDVPDRLFDMEMRYFNLLERLRSTEVKIEKFRDRYIFGPEDYSPIIHGMAFSGKNKSRSIYEKHDEAPAFRHAPAFSAFGGKLSGVSDQGSEAHGDCPHVAAKSAHGTVTCDASLPVEQVSGVSDQGTVNEEVRMKNEEQGSVISGQGSEIEEASVSASRPSTCQREQLSKAGSHEKVAETLHKNEDGVRSRQGSDSGADCGKSLNEEGSSSTLNPVAHSAGTAEVPKDKEECSALPDSPSRQHGSGEPVSACSGEKLPHCLEIMKRVMERSREAADDSLTFTIDEMEFLARDPLFARLDPRLAADLRKILEKGPPD